MTALNINGVKCTDPKLISTFVTTFYNDLYTSEFNMDNCENFLKTIRNHIPVIDNDFKDFCEATLTIEEIKSALFSMKKNKSPGVDGFSVNTLPFASNV